MTNFGHFAGFPIFSPKMWLRLTRNGQFHLIHNFSHLLPPKHLILGEISKIFIPGEGGTLANILSFSTYLNHFTLEWLKMTLNGKFVWKKWLRLAPKSQFLSFCRFIHLFPQNEAQIDLEWPISPYSQLFPSFATKVSHFWRNLKNFSFLCKIYQQIFWVFELFWIISHWSGSKWPSIANFAKKVA